MKNRDYFLLPTSPNQQCMWPNIWAFLPDPLRLLSSVFSEKKGSLSLTLSLKKIHPGKMLSCRSLKNDPLLHFEAPSVLDGETKKNPFGLSSSSPFQIHGSPASSSLFFVWETGEGEGIRNDGQWGGMGSKGDPPSFKTTIGRRKRRRGGCHTVYLDRAVAGCGGVPTQAKSVYAPPLMCVAFAVSCLT